VGEQFTAEAVDALVRLYEAGEVNGRPEAASAVSSPR
jgi:hypothetical protein